MSYAGITTMSYKETTKQMILTIITIVLAIIAKVLIIAACIALFSAISAAMLLAPNVFFILTTIFLSIAFIAFIVAASAAALAALAEQSNSSKSEKALAITKFIALTFALSAKTVIETYFLLHLPTYLPALFGNYTFKIGFVFFCCYFHVIAITRLICNTGSNTTQAIAIAAFIALLPVAYTVFIDPNFMQFLANNIAVGLGIHNNLSPVLLLFAGITLASAFIALTITKIADEASEPTCCNAKPTKPSTLKTFSQYRRPPLGSNQFAAQPIGQPTSTTRTRATSP